MVDVCRRFLLIMRQANPIKTVKLLTALMSFILTFNRNKDACQNTIACHFFFTKVTQIVILARSPDQIQGENWGMETAQLRGALLLY